jgi:hypothetical protein
MEGFTRIGNDVAWITNVIRLITSFHPAESAVYICLIILAPRCIVFSSVCDWKLIMTTGNHPHNVKCYATPFAFNI